MNVNKVGRPTKPTELKKEVKQEYDKKYYQTVTKNKRIVQTITKKYDQEADNEAYKSAIVHKFSSYDFNYFFTATSEANYLHRQQMELHNKEIIAINKELDTELSLQHKNLIPIYGLKNYTEKYINHLIENKAIDRAIIFYEQNKAKEWHTHLLLNVVNPRITAIESYLENKWILGISMAIIIDCKKKILEYCVKQFNIYSSKKAEKDKVLNWNIMGYYEKQKTKIINMKKTITNEQLELYKIKNKLNDFITKDFFVRQKQLQERYITRSA